MRFLGDLAHAEIAGINMKPPTWEEAYFWIYHNTKKSLREGIKIEFSCMNVLEHL